MTDTSQSDEDPQIDDDLWVELTDSDGRWYLSGNPHTFPGRFDVWSRETGSSLTVSKSDVANASEAARWWIEGFLSGNEPSLVEYLGWDTEDVWDLETTDPAYRRWRAVLEHFRRTGETLFLEQRPVAPMPVDTIRGHTPWVWAGGELWTWTGDEWRVSEAQPGLSDFPAATPLVLPGTVCVDQEHEMEVIGDQYVSCVNCGWTTTGIVA